jgi:hypothetical protein
MLRKLFGFFAVAVVLCVGVVLADEIKGTIKKVDADNKKVTVTVDGNDKTFDVSDDAKLPGRQGKNGTLKALQKAVDKAADKGGYKAVLQTDDNKKVTEIKRDTAK